MISFHAIAADGMVENFTGTMEPAVLDVCAATAVMVRGRKYRKPWVGYIVTADGKAIGSCAFKSAPVENSVEVGYFTFPGYEGKGFATAMLRALVKIARTVRPDIVLTAQTLPQESASTKVLEKCAFEYIGMVSHPEDGLVWEWRLAPGV